MFIYMSSVVCICIFAKLFIEMYMYICFVGLREDWLSQLSYPHKIKKLLTYLLVLGIGIVKLLFETDLNELFGKVSALNWKKISYILG